MSTHNDLICRLDHVENSYDDRCDHCWYENQGICLETDPDWPADSVMVVSWPQHVLSPRFNGDCTISGPYADLAEAMASSRDGAEIMPDLT